MMRTLFGLIGLLAVSIVPMHASATSVTFLGSGTGPGGVGVAASAVFEISGNNLTITLANTSAAHSSALQDVPGSTLTGLFWNSASGRALTPFSATVAGGSSIIQSPSLAGTTNVAGEFGYLAAASFSGGPSGANRGIASSGYLNTGLPGNIGNFNNGSAGTNLQDPASLDGINFGIVSANGTLNANGGLESVPLIRSAVVFMLTGVSGLTLADIANVSFQYGTGFSELNVHGCKAGDINCDGGKVPEPGTMLLVGGALLALSQARRQQATRRPA